MYSWKCANPLFFISYRRETEAGIATRLESEINRHYGDGCAFLDRQITPGNEFPNVLEREIKQRPFMLVVIGKTWVEEILSRKYQNKKDFVRYEVELAVQHLTPERCVIPITQDPSYLPTVMHRQQDDLCSRMENLHAHIIRNDGDFKTDVRELIKQLRKFNSVETVLNDTRTIPDAIFVAQLTKKMVPVLKHVIDDFLIQRRVDQQAHLPVSKGDYVKAIDDFLRPVEYCIRLLKRMEQGHSRVKITIENLTEVEVIFGTTRAALKTKGCDVKGATDKAANEFEKVCGIYSTMTKDAELFLNTLADL